MEREVICALSLSRLAAADRCRPRTVWPGSPAGALCPRCRLHSRSELAAEGQI